MFASNFPVDRINGTFPQLMVALDIILQPYSEDDRCKFFLTMLRNFTDYKDQ